MRTRILFLILFLPVLLLAQTKQDSVTVQPLSDVPAIAVNPNSVFLMQTVVEGKSVWTKFTTQALDDYLARAPFMDSTRVLSGNILVSWKDGVEVARDTLNIPEGGGVTTLQLADSITAVRNEFLVLDTTITSDGTDLNAAFFTTQFATYSELRIDAQIEVGAGGDFIINLNDADLVRGKKLFIAGVDYSGSYEIIISGIQGNPNYPLESGSNVYLQSQLLDGAYEWVLINGAVSSSSPFTVDNDTIGASQFRLALGNSGNFSSNDGGFFEIPNRLYFFDDGFSTERNYFFGDIEDWSTRHGDLAYSLANNFHYWTQGNSGSSRVEFENDSGSMQFYIEGINQAWYGLQNGASHLWSSGYQTSTTGEDWIWNPSFGLDATPVMGLSRTGRFYVLDRADIGTLTADNSAVLNLVSTDAGFLPPRMTTTQKNAISSPSRALIVDDSDLNELQRYNGSSWEALGSAYSPKPVSYSNPISIDLESKANGIYSLNMDSTSSIYTLSISNPVNGGEYAIWPENCTNDTITFPDNFLTINRDSLKTRLCNSTELLEFFYDGTNYISRDTFWNEYTIPLSPLILDQITPQPAIAIGLRKLRNGYSGNCIEVRRSIDSLTQNIGFLGESLDTTSLLTFCASTDCFVSIVYDQGANGLNAVQDSLPLQPKIVTTGVMEKSNGYVSMLFDGGDELIVADNDALSATNGAGADLALSAFLVYDQNTGTSNRVFFSKDGVSNGAGTNREYALGTFSSSGTRFLIKNGGGNDQQSIDVDSSALGHKQQTMIYDGSESYTGISFWRDGAVKALTSFTNGTYAGMSNTSADFVIGSQGAINWFIGDFQEIIIYMQDITTDRTVIESSQINYYRN